MRIVVRTATKADGDACGRVCYEAFKAIADEHNFPSDWPSMEATATSMAAVLAHSGFYAAVAEDNRRVVGMCFLDERATVVGLGPIAVDPKAQGGSVGRQLMQHVLDRADRDGREGVRLVQAAYNNQSLSLYVKLGFEVREPLSVMQGAPISSTVPGLKVRTARQADLTFCNELCFQVHGYDRSRELAEAIHAKSATVVETEERICGYATCVGFRGHAVGESNDVLRALIGEARVFPGTGFLLPSRNSELFRWCLDQGLRVMQQMTYMSRGRYDDPRGRFLPSILA